MPNIRLSAAARRGFIAIMILGEEASNPIVHGRFGFEIKTEHRTELVKAGLIVAGKKEGRGNTLFFNITKEGWSYTKELFGMPVREYVPARQKRDDSTTRLAMGILKSLGRFMSDNNIDAKDVFKPAVGDWIHAAYDKLAKGTTDMVRLDRLRSELRDIDAEELTAGLMELYEKGEAILAAEENRMAITDELADAGVEIGGETRHLIAIGRR